ncbi:MAG: pantoate--beta-alanine ligase [Acidobacteriia bacterium]|nr:pantoate--beta-alanine ligase [Terriglobia bacterium]
MRLITSIAEMQGFARQARSAGKSLALVPTMGALHEGHLSLVHQARRQCDVVVVSIFVNPTQFGPAEDVSRYPRNLEKDLEAIHHARVDAVFAPSASEIYPESFETFVLPGETAAPLEGASRLGHFRGVATVVLKLLNIVRPDISYFGQKDFQQALVIRRLVEDLNLETRLVICPVVREADGLAMSSRNAYLSTEERQAATVLSRSLRRAEEMAHKGETQVSSLLEEMRRVFAAEPRAQLDYAAIVDPVRLQPVERVTSGCVALVAARIGPARLIDNLIFGPPGTSAEMLLQLALTAEPVTSTQARIPGLETDVLRLKIANCHDCAAISSIRLPPREFLAKYVKRDYPDLNVVRTAIIGRDAPLNAEQFLYHSPQRPNRFVSGLYELVGVKDFSEFKSRFVLMDALRCHSTLPHAPEKALAYCAKHLREELKLFPNLETIVALGEDAYLQFQRYLLDRSAEEIQPFDDLLKTQGWASENVHISPLGERTFRVLYCYHPTYGYKRSPPVAAMLE